MKTPIESESPAGNPASIKQPMVLHARVVTSTGGGPDKTILNSPRFLKKLGYESHCVFFHPPRDDGFDVLRQRAVELSAPLIEIEDRRKIDVAAIKRAIQICRDTQASIWHAHDYKTNLIGLIARRFHPMKLVTTAHGWVNFAGPTPLYYRLDKRWWLPRYERVICVSPTVLQQCLAAGIAESQCVLIDNAIDHRQFSRRRSISEAKRQQFGVSESQLLIGAMGRLAEEKGFDLLIESFRRLIGMGIDAKLVIAGEGPEQHALEQLAAESGIAERIELIGFCQDTRAFLESLDIFVLSSRREGLPNVVLEAMAVGAAVIATRCGGIERLVEDRTNGLVIDVGNVEQLTKAMQQLATSQELRRQYSSAAVEVIADHWSFEQRIGKVADIYDQLLSR